MFTLRGSYGKSKRPGLDQGTVLSLVPGFFIEQFSHKSSLVRCSCFRLRGLGQNLGNGFLSSEGLVLPACRACFLSYVHFVWQAWGIRDILGSKTSLCVTGAGRRTLFSFAWQAWHCLDVAKTLASVGQNERCFWRSFCMAGGVFGELGRRLERVESLVVWSCRHFWFWTWWWFRVAGAALWMPRAHCSWQVQYFVHLNKKWLRPI